MDDKYNEIMKIVLDKLVDEGAAKYHELEGHLCITCNHMFTLQTIISMFFKLLSETIVETHNEKLFKVIISDIAELFENTDITRYNNRPSIIFNDIDFNFLITK